MSDRELTPRQVAERLGIPTDRARRYMASGVIRSIVSTTTRDDRVYYRTFESELERYRNRVGERSEVDTDAPAKAFSPISFSEIWS